MYRFPENLKNLRINKGLSLNKLSNELKINAKTLSNWEKGKTDPTSHFLIILSKYFNIKVDNLLGLNKQQKKC